MIVNSLHPEIEGSVHIKVNGKIETQLKSRAAKAKKFIKRRSRLIPLKE
jgi:hypothetical protein